MAGAMVQNNKKDFFRKKKPVMPRPLAAFT
jgi:hypothetical protein